MYSGLVLEIQRNKNMIPLKKGRPLETEIWYRPIFDDIIARSFMRHAYNAGYSRTSSAGSIPYFPYQHRFEKEEQNPVNLSFNHFELLVS